MPALKTEKSAWLKFGIESFSVSGIQGVNIEQMAKKLNCNKSSFYWHFKNRENFVNEMIQYWFNISTKPIINEVNTEEDPKIRFEIFINLSFKDKSRKDFMFHLRHLAETSIILTDLLTDLTNKRLMYTTLMIQGLGYEEEESKLKAEILLNFYLGWYELNKNKNPTTGEHDIEHAILLIKNFINY